MKRVAKKSGDHFLKLFQYLFKIFAPIVRKNSLSFLFILFLSSCSSLFYYPDQRQYVRTEKLSYKPEDIYFNSGDGTKLHGWYIERSNKKQPPKALIVHFHGNAQNLTSHFLSFEWIQKLGFDYFIFDYRGYGKSQGKPSPKGTIEDGYAALRWAHARNPDVPLIVIGQSLGGAISLRAVADLKNEIPIKLMVVDSTFHSYQEIGRKTLSRSWLFWLFQPMAYIVLSDKWAPYKKIAEISPTKLIVIHGTKDHMIPASFGKRIYELAKDPKDYWEIPEGGHIDFTWRIKEGYRERLIKEFEAACCEGK